MEIAIVVLIVLVSVLLIIVVLVQNSKGGGLATNIGISSNQFGVKKTSDFLEKLTWGLAIALVVLCLGVNLVMDKGEESDFPSSINVEKARESKSVPSLPQGKPSGTKETAPATAPEAAPAAKPEENK